jgi:hypothetical protein
MAEGLTRSRPLARLLRNLRSAARNKFLSPFPKRLKSESRIQEPEWPGSTKVRLRRSFSFFLVATKGLARPALFSACGESDENAKPGKPRQANANHCKGFLEKKDCLKNLCSICVHLWLFPALTLM